MEAPDWWVVYESINHGSCGRFNGSASNRACSHNPDSTSSICSGHLCNRLKCRLTQSAPSLAGFCEYENGLALIFYAYPVSYSSLRRPVDWLVSGITPSRRCPSIKLSTSFGLSQVPQNAFHRLISPSYGVSTYFRIGFYKCCQVTEERFPI